MTTPLFIEVGGAKLSTTVWTIREPLQGAWLATLHSVGIELDALPPAVGSPVELVEGAARWSGTVTRSVRTGLGSICSIVVEGGAGRSREATTARHWSGSVSAAEVLRTLCGDVGERAEGDGPQLGSWRARGRSLEEEAAELARWTGTRVYCDQGGAWRADALAYPEADAPGYQLGGELMSVSYERRELVPLAATTIEGRRVAYAVHTVGRVDTYEPPTRQSAVGAIVGATVDTCDDGRVSVTTDDGVAMVDIPIWSAPGLRAIVPGGTRVLVADLGGDARATFAMLAPWESEPTSMHIGAGASEVLIADGRQTVIRELDLLTVASPIIPGVPFTLTLAAPPLASKVKA